MKKKRMVPYSLALLYLFRYRTTLLDPCLATLRVLCCRLGQHLPDDSRCNVLRSVQCLVTSVGGAEQSRATHSRACSVVVCCDGQTQIGSERATSHNHSHRCSRWPALPDRLDYRYHPVDCGSTTQPMGIVRQSNKIEFGFLSFHPFSFRVRSTVSRLAESGNPCVHVPPSPSLGKGASCN